MIIPGLSFFACGGNGDTNEETDNLPDNPKEQLVAFSDFVGNVKSLQPIVENLDEAYNMFEANKTGFTPEEKDSACILYVDLMDKISLTEDKEDKGDNYKDLKEKFEPYGFNIGGGEGYLWLIPDVNAAGKRFEKDISSDLREYLRLGEITGKQYSADAGMMISYEEWGDILIDLEDRIRANRDSKYYDRFIVTYQDYLYWYMWGMDNTPITDWDTGYLSEEVKAAYSKLVDDKTHRTGEIIRLHWFEFEVGGPEIAMEEHWEPTKEEIEHYFYDELEEME